MPIKLYSSITAKKEVFKPLYKNKLSLYVCGPTVYGDTHAGHAKTYVSFDIILRWFKFKGYKTFYVQNITDVGHLVGDADEGEDKISKKAKDAKTEPMAIAETYSRQFFDTMDRLGVIRADISPRASGHIPEQLDAIEKMIDKGVAYESNGSVYFDINQFKNYGLLSNRKTKDLKEATRVEVRSDKKSNHDFALWKKAESDHLMRWKDPWSGWGFPGWHTECVVMSSKYLGQQFDIHGGGMDLKFPHHECEIAQTEALEYPFANYWMHSNLLTINGQKMSKSAGNYKTVNKLLEIYAPEVLRYFFATSHYRSVVDISDHALDSAKNAVNKFIEITRQLRNIIPEQFTKPPNFKHYKKSYQVINNCMNDDFATPKVVAELILIMKSLNKYIKEPYPYILLLKEAEYILSSIGGKVLGFIPDKIEQKQNDDLTDSIMDSVINLRSHFRDNKDYQNSDLIRDEFKKVNITFKDGKEGISWKVEK